MVFAGKVGTGFTDKKRTELNKMFKEYKTNKCPLEKEPNLKDKITFLKPELVAEIQYTELTRDKILRQPSFIDIRIDKKANQVVLEEKDDK